MGTPAPTVVPTTIRTAHSQGPAAHVPLASFGGLSPAPLAGFQRSFADQPYAWAGSAVPPGAEALGSRLQVGSTSPPTLAPRAASGNWGPNTSAPLGGCYGIWPSKGGQSTYADDCYGHDEPGIDFYSTLPGSGGNITWNVTLPTSDGGLGDSQSDLYSAIWFGMTFSDPYSWDDQCFLELQFYPDSSWGSSSAVYGNWVGAAVAWQIEALTGSEDACFYQELALTNNPSAPFNMNQGDQITLAMSGYVGDPYGENLTITDVTTGGQSFVNFYDYSQRVPLDPAYSQNSWPNALQWTPGGELPAVFAFETGHTVYPYPNNNSYGGCSGGVPPPTAQDPAVPCPSYDPASWVNDTLTPWHIAVPTFSNGSATERSAQVSFTQDLGGIAFIDYVSNGSCVGRDGSAYCSYPWYSYACDVHAFEFGATDYGGVSDDFGQYDEYAQVAQQDVQQFGFYPPTNFSVPTCGAASYNLTVSSANPTLGAAYFLSTPYRAGTAVRALGPGEYSISAIPTAGDYFDGWSTTGGATVASDLDPDTTVHLSGDGTVTASFAAGPPGVVSVTFDDSPSSGHIAVLAGFLYSTGAPIATLADGGTLNLTPGVYSVQAYPMSGYNFSKWSISGSGAAIAAPYLPVTALDVFGTAGSFTVTETSVSSSSTDLVIFGTYYGEGSVSFDGGTLSTYSYTSATVGTYPVDAVPSAGYTFDGWIDSSPLVITDFQASTNVTLENGSYSYFFAEFFPAPVNVTLASSSAPEGGISFQFAPPVASATQALPPGNYTLLPVPTPTDYFAGWSVSSRAALWVYPIGNGFFDMDVNTTGTATANFGTGESVVNLSFAIDPPGAGTIVFDFASYANGSENSTLSDGIFPVAAVPTPGWSTVSLTSSGGVGLPDLGLANVTGRDGVLTAKFERSSYPVTFLANAASGSSFVVNGTAVPNGANVMVPSGGVTVTLKLPEGPTFLGWAGSPSLEISGANNSTTLYALGPGTVTALAFGFSAIGGILPRTTIDLGETVVVSAAATGLGPFSYAWAGVPPGCAAGGLPSFRCTPNDTGAFPIFVDVLGPQAESVNLSVGTLIVLPPLVVTPVVATPANFTVGGSTSLSITVTGGAVPYTIAYSGLPAGCAAANTQSFTCTPDPNNGSGLYDVEAVIGDTTGTVAYASGLLQVNPPPTFEGFSVNRSVTDIGHPVLFGDATGGGTGPITIAYSGLPGGCASVNATELPCTPSSTGNFTVGVSARDFDGFTATATTHLTVNALPEVSGFAATPANVTLNGTVRLEFAIVGGTAPYRVSFTGLPAGCFSANTTDLTCVPRQTGVYAVTAHVTDALGESAAAGLNFSIQNQSQSMPHPVTSAPPGGGVPPLTIALVLILIVLLVYLGIRLARRRPSPQPDYDDERADASAPPPEGAGAPPTPPTTPDDDLPLR